jgi:hypothetical protein
MSAIRDISLSDTHISYLDAKYVELNSVKQVEESTEPDKPKKTKNQIELENHIAEFELGSDIVYSGGEFDVVYYLSRNDVTPAMAKHIAAHFKLRLQELDEIPTDEQLQESYSCYSEQTMTNIHKFVEFVISTCEDVKPKPKVIIKKKKRKK